MKNKSRLFIILLSLTAMLILVSSCAFQSEEDKEKRAVAEDLDRIERVIKDSNETSVVGELKIECYIDDEYNNIVSKQESYTSQAPYSHQYTESLGILVNDKFSEKILQSGYKDGKMYSYCKEGTVSDGFYSPISANDYKQYYESVTQDIIIDSENIQIELYEKSENGISIKYRVTGNQEIIKLQNIYFANIGILISDTHKIRAIDFEIQADKDYNLLSYKISLDFLRVAKTEKRFTPIATFELKEIEYSDSAKYDVDFKYYNECDDLRPYEIAKNDLYCMIGNESGKFKNTTVIEQKAKYQEMKSDSTQELSFVHLDSGFSYQKMQTDELGIGLINKGKSTKTAYNYVNKILTSYYEDAAEKTTNYESDKPAYLTVIAKITPVELTLEGLSSIKAVDGKEGVYELYYDEPRYDIDATSDVIEDYAKIIITIADSKLVKLEYKLFLELKGEQTYEANIVCEYY